MMYRKSAATLALFVFFLTSASIAFADAVLVGGVTFTPRSGVAGTTTTDIGPPGTLHALNWVTVGERFDNPCRLTVTKSDINGSGDSLFADWGECTTTSPAEGAGFTDESRLHVYGIKACTNSSDDDRLKGIFLFGGAILSDGSFFQLAFPATFARTNCNTWHTPVYCPAGQVATRVRIHHTGDTISGLSLGCRRVALQ